MAIRTAYSEKEIDQVVSDMKSQLGSFKPNFVVFFASAKYEPEEISRTMNEAFGPISVIGSSTAGEIVSGRMLQNSVVAMFFDAETVADVSVAVAENIRAEDQVPAIFAGFENHFKTPMASMEIEKYVGLILVDGLSGSEERVMEKIGDLTDVIFIGGSAGDDLKFQRTYVYAGGKAYTNAALLALIKVNHGFEVIKTQSFRSLGKTLVATEVDEQARKVITFNDKPAIDAYAEALGVNRGEAVNRFMTNPVGLVVGDDFYVRSPQQAQESSMIFYCNIREGMELSVLESQNIVEDTGKAVESKMKEMESTS
ncbi:MAG TPA: FIST N-terminal domain-containing protein, partial [Dissulfurispiraceae bacterium]|nr:FIST N-terminal domain-containing protein [Dissulfurispiraceae bacterium]